MTTNTQNAATISTEAKHGVLPARPANAGELSDTELDKVVGGDIIMAPMSIPSC